MKKNKVGLSFGIGIVASGITTFCIWVISIIMINARDVICSDCGLMNSMLIMIAIFTFMITSFMSYKLMSDDFKRDD